MPRGRTSHSDGRAYRRRQRAALQLVATGVGLSVLSLVLAPTPFGQAFGAILPVGIVIAVLGGILYMFSGESRSSMSASAHSNATASSGPLPRQRAPRVPDLVLEEFERSSRETKQDNAGASGIADRPATWSKAVFEVIEWRRFEAVVERLFQQAGFVTHSQSHGADEGIDVWLFASSRPDVPIGLIQCKHWAEKSVGVSKIRELRGAMAAKSVQRGLFATTAGFTPEARQFALENGIDLLDQARLLELIAKRPMEQQAELLQVALQGEYWCPTCAQCGAKMVERKRRVDGGKFWGCSTYPKCRNMLPMRAVPRSA